MRRAVALAVVLLAVPGAATAGAAAPVARDVDRPDGPAVELVDRGPCPPCAWPATGADWGPLLAAASGETIEVTLDSPADAVEVSASTNPNDGSAAEPVFGPLAAAPAGGGGAAPASAWRVALPDLGPHAREGLALAVVVHRGAAGQAATATLYTPSPFVYPSPRPPPFAFRSVALDTRRGVLTVRLQSVAELDVAVTVARKGRRVAHRRAHIRAGQPRIVMPLSRRGRARLGGGRRVDVILRVGGFELRSRAVPLRRR